jgi:hypothetical protein
MSFVTTDSQTNTNLYLNAKWAYISVEQWLACASFKLSDQNSLQSILNIVVESYRV